MHSVRPTTPYFDTVYGAAPDTGVIAAELPVFTMWPSLRSSMSGMKVRTPFTTPMRFTPSVHAQTSVGISHAGGPWWMTPALLHTTCHVPNADLTASASASTLSGRVTSVGTASTSG